MKIFVTGGSGFVGQPLLKELVHNGYEVYALARSPRSMKLVQERGAIPIEGNLTNASALMEALDGIDAIVHVAAKIEMWGRYHDFHAVNVQGTKELLSAAIAQGVKKFVYISSAAVVSDGSELVDITESYKPRRIPSENYSRTKALAEQEILEMSGSIQTVILRPPLIWGPRMQLIEDFRDHIEKRGFPTIGNADHTLATCHISNLNAAIALALKHENAKGVFFITDGQKMPLRVFLKRLAAGYGLDMGDARIPRGVALVVSGLYELIWGLFRLKGNPPLTRSMVRFIGTEFSINDEKARKELHYENVIGIDEGLEELIAARR